MNTIRCALELHKEFSRCEAMKKESIADNYAVVMISITTYYTTMDATE